MLKRPIALFVAITLTFSMPAQSLPSNSSVAEATQGQHSVAIEYLLSAAASMGDAQGDSISRQSVGTEGGPDVDSAKCCKVCRKGKACGDSCIAKWKQCHKAPGCACDG